MPTDCAKNHKVERKLVAILAADIAGYSLLMGADEEATVRDLKACQAVVLPMIGGHGGRVIDTAGDGILAEFSSVLNAVKCAVSFQKTMAERNAAVDPARRMNFRIGVNQGDVIFDDARVYGDGVNIAAPLEAMAEPGGIYITDKVYAEIGGRINVTCQDMGPQSLKNIAAPVRVYRIELRNEQPALPQRDKTPLSLPDKPSIAVLPFTNMSGDPGQEYFSDGITEDIITELSRFSELFVIARNSSFTYKGKPVDIRAVGRELGVRYVLEGSIRRSGDRVRITAQLIDDDRCDPSSPREQGGNRTHAAEPAHNLIAWLGNAANGIDKIFAHEIIATNGTFTSINTGSLSASSTISDVGTFGKLCVGTICITQDEFMSVFGPNASSQSASAAAGNSNSSGVAAGAPSGLSAETSSGPPIITINGGNPATIPVGTTYADLGANITGPKPDLNLGIHFFVDGAPIDAVQLDTSTPGIHSIDYVVTGHSGLTSTTTRTVIVSASQAANDNPALEQASSSPPAANDNSPAPELPETGTE